MFTITTVIYGQDFKHLTSETKYEDEITFKKRVINLNISVQREIAGDESPTAFFISGGYDFRWLNENKVFYAISPRAKLGWISGDNGYETNERERVSHNTLAWGFSVAPSIGLEVEEEHHTIIYLEGELGLLNYNAKSKFNEQFAEPYKRIQNQNTYAKPFAAIRIGLLSNFSQGFSMAVWAGLTTIKTNQFLDKMNLNSRVVDDRNLDGEIGVSFIF